MSIFSRLLVRHSNVMERLRREIASIMEVSPTPSREQIRKMPYLACVIKESTSYINKQFVIMVGEVKH